MTLLLIESDIGSLLTYPVAVEEVFALLGAGEASNGPRQRTTQRTTTLDVTPGASAAPGGMGVKSYPIVRSDAIQSSSFTFLLYSLPEGDLLAILKAEVLGQRRTGAASAVATWHLARRNSRSLTAFGAGWQAESEVEAIANVHLELERVLVVRRSRVGVERFVRTVSSRLSVPIRPTVAEEAVPVSDVVVTATGSATPVFDGSLVPPGCHINAVGSNFAARRELGAETICHAGSIVAGSTAVASSECGDLLGVDFDWDRLVDLGAVAAGHASGRSGDEGITLFESQGLAAEDLACAIRVVRRAREEGCGVILPLS